MCVKSYINIIMSYDHHNSDLSWKWAFIFNGIMQFNTHIFKFKKIVEKNSLYIREKTPTNL